MPRSTHCLVRATSLGTLGQLIRMPLSAMLPSCDFYREFSTDDKCLRYLFALRFPHVECTQCGRGNSYSKHPTQARFTCNCGRSQIYPRKDTIFEDSPLPLTTWFYGIFLLSTTDILVTPRMLEQKLDVTYDTAWNMASRIRSALPMEREANSAPRSTKA